LTKLGIGANGEVLTVSTDVPAWTAIAGTGDVTAAAVLANNSLIRGDGGAKGIQDSGILIDDTDNLSAVASINISLGGDLQINSASVLNATTLGAAVVSSSLTSVGTISSGIWQGTTIAVDQGGSGQTSYVDGQLLIGNTTGNTLAKGTLTSADADLLDITNGSGSITLGIDTKFEETGMHGWNGSLLESASVTVTSDGATITCSVELNGGGDLTAVFSDGYYAWDTSPADTVTLTAGSDISPQINYVYLLQSTKTLTASTTAFPATEYAPIATVLCQSAASLQTDGPYKMHAWTDHVISSNDQGHIPHLNFWIRKQQATWVSGAATTYSDGAATFDVIIASGVVLQLHEQTYPAFNTSTGSDVYIVNDSATAYKKVGDLTGETTDASGVSMAGQWYSLVFWGVVNEATGDCKLMCNLPTSSYNNNNGNKAVNDDEGYNVFTIPSDFTGVGFLISKLTVSESAGTFTVQNNEDLRGQFPSTSPGSGATGGNEFIDNVFRIQDDGDTTKQIAFQASGITTATTRTITMADADIDLTPSTGSFGDTFKVGTPVDSQIGVWTGDGTIEGDADFTFDTSTDTLAIAASGKLNFGAVNILSDAAGTTTLNNIDAIDATTETTFETAIDSLSNLVTVGALDSGSITANFGSINIGASTFDTTGAVSTGALTATTYSGSGDMTVYEAVIDGNPEIRLGSADAEELHIQSVYDSGAQTLDYVLFQTDAASATANKGLYRFNVDGADICDIDDGGIDLDSGKALSIAGTDVLNATTLGTNVVSSSLTSVGTIGTGTWQGTAIADEYGGTGQTTYAKGDILYASAANTLAKLPIGGDGEVLTVNVDVPNWEAAGGGGNVSNTGTPVDNQLAVWTNATTVEGDAALTFDTSTDTLAIGASGNLNFGAVTILADAAGTTTLQNVDALDATTETTIEAAIDTLANLTSATSLASVGTVTTGTWSATDVAVDSGGSGRGTATAYAVICGGTTATGAHQSIASVGTSGQVLTSNGAGALPTFQAGGAGGMPDAVYQWSARALDVNYTPFSPLEKITTTNIIQKVRSFDYATIEYSDGFFEVPPDMDTTGTITFSVQWFARTVPSPSENVIWQIEHAAVATTEDLDSATFTAEVAAASATGTTQNALVRVTWTETRANLGWVAGDTVYVKWSRKSTDALDTFDTAATTADDALLVNAAIIIPQA